MAARLNPYLMFPGTARKAMRFYESVLGGTLTLITFGDAGAQGVPDPDQVMHAMLETDDGLVLMASDLPPGSEHEVGASIAVSLSGDDGERLRGHWDALCEGATVTVPLARQVWGDDFGALTDRFGVPWMLNVAGSPQG